MNITVKMIDKARFDNARAVRTAVFCDEQGYSVDDEFDEHDEFCDDTAHFVAYDGERAVGTSRVIIGDSDYACKFGRVAVLKEYRKYGVGRLLMNAMLDYAKSRSVTEIELDSQLRAMDFYAKFGFEPFGEVHPDGHVMHRRMALKL